MISVVTTSGCLCDIIIACFSPENLLYMGQEKINYLIQKSQILKGECYNTVHCVSSQFNVETSSWFIFYQLLFKNYSLWVLKAYSDTYL